MYPKGTLCQFHEIAQSLFDLIRIIWSASEASEAGVLAKQQLPIIKTDLTKENSTQLPNFYVYGIYK